MTALRFSANLGFLWTDRPLPDAIAAAAAVGFDAVECHMPYDVESAAVAAALTDAGLKMVSLNTLIGDAGAGDLGVAAVPGRDSEAHDYIDQAVAYATDIGCAHVSVVAGRTGRTAAAEATYRANLAYAAEQAAGCGIGVLIEPLNTRVADDYHLVSIAAGLSTIEAVGASNLRLMVDCFHTQIMEGDLTETLRSALPHVGHIQFAAVPDRGEPDAGEVNYPWLLPTLVELGYAGLFGAEYTPRAGLEAGLGWLAEFRSIAT